LACARKAQTKDNIELFDDFIQRRINQSIRKTVYNYKTKIRTLKKTLEEKNSLIQNLFKELSTSAPKWDPPKPQTDNKEEEPGKPEVEKRPTDPKLEREVPKAEPIPEKPAEKQKEPQASEKPNTESKTAKPPTEEEPPRKKPKLGPVESPTKILIKSLELDDDPHITAALRKADPELIRLKKTVLFSTRRRSKLEDRLYF
jgi:hypothetical protein